MNYRKKYIKYKRKYISLKYNLKGGDCTIGEEKFTKDILKNNESRNQLVNLISQLFEWKEIKSNEMPENYKQKIEQMDKDTYKLEKASEFNKLGQNYPCGYYVLCNNNQEILGGFMYWISKFGKKISRSFSSDSKTYGRMVMLKKAELMSINGWFGEQSGATAYMLKEYFGLKPITNKNVVKTIIETYGGKLTDDDFSKTFDTDGKYYRKIQALGNKLEEKQLFGKPCIPLNDDQLISGSCNYECKGLLL